MGFNTVCEVMESTVIHGTSCTIMANARITGHNNVGVQAQPPYFSVTGKIITYCQGDIKFRRIETEINDAFPETIANYTKYNFFALGEGPMSYIEHALYFAGNRGRRWQDSEESLELFLSHICYGTIDEEYISDFLASLFFSEGESKEISESKEALLTGALIARLPLLLEAFNRDMTVLFGESEYQNALDDFEKYKLVKEWL